MVEQEMMSHRGGDTRERPLAGGRWQCVLGSPGLFNEFAFYFGSDVRPQRELEQKESVFPVLLESLRPLNREGMGGALAEAYGEEVSTAGIRETCGANRDVSNKSRGLSICVCF